MTALKKQTIRITLFVLPIFFVILASDLSYALPAFLFREKQENCTLCHTNNSAPHLTKEGYIYRRAGFRFPADIGNIEKDTKNIDLLHHLAAGINIDYANVKNKPLGQEETTVNNNVNAREVELYPLIGSFYGNYSAWSELTMEPETPGDRTAPTPPGMTTSTNGGVGLEQAELRYVFGNADLYYSIRAGLIAQEGYGASDQWLDDANIPLMDQLTAYYNQDTLVLPLGAFQSPQMGVEFGINLPNTYLTLGILNGFDGGNGFANHVPSSVNPRLTSPEGKYSHDYKIQLEQFFNDQFALTAIYYSGGVPLLDPTNTFVWWNNYQTSRLYLTYSMHPAPVDIFLGGSYGNHDYVNSGTTNKQGTFFHQGSFLGANWYVLPYLTLSMRLDQHTYAVDKPPSAKGGSLMASLTLAPRSLFVFHYNVTDSDLNSGSTLAGRTNDFRAEWRFFF
ncbi:MAG: hypothetical protein ACXVCP_14080 [Bdellovibrio sp.]